MTKEELRKKAIYYTHERRDKINKHIEQGDGAYIREDDVYSLMSDFTESLQSNVSVTDEVKDKALGVCFRVVSYYEDDLKAIENTTFIEVYNKAKRVLKLQPKAESTND